ncbi:MAG: hypothetical protein M1836_007023 [Candelina mexicana]|nr:MAG: hypothetical protein M1836_007023 [Candelina mexicana]
MHVEREVPFALPLGPMMNSDLSVLYFRPTVFAELVWSSTTNLRIIPDITYLNVCLSTILIRHFTPIQLALNKDKVNFWFEQLNESQNVKKVLRNIKITNGLNPDGPLTLEEQRDVYESQAKKNPYLRVPLRQIYVNSSGSRKTVVPICFSDIEIEEEGTTKCLQELSQIHTGQRDGASSITRCRYILAVIVALAAVTIAVVGRPVIPSSNTAAENVALQRPSNDQSVPVLLTTPAAPRRTGRTVRTVLRVRL